MPHQYHPHVNRQLPFLVTLDLPDLSRLTNDPILHYPFWPVIPAKLPFDIPKFDSKVGEDPNNHVMAFHLWCSSNSLMDDSIHLHIFREHLRAQKPSGISNFHVVLSKILTPLPCPFSHTFNYPFDTIRVPKS